MTTMVTVSKDMNVTATFEQEISVRKGLVSPGNLTMSFSFESAAANVIHYSAATPGKVTIALYNVMGKQITTPVDKHVAAGRYTTPLHTLPAGMYWVRMRSSDGETAQRITITR
jgi:hypothetical protein